MNELLNNLMGNMFGGGGGYMSMLDEEARRRINNQSMMSMAAALLQAGGPSTKRTSLGQALGGAWKAGQEAQGSAVKDELTGMLTKQKIDEYNREKEREANWQRMILGAGAPMTAQDAIAAPVTPALPAGPTVARAGMIGQLPAAAPGSVGSILNSMPPAMRALMPTMGYKEGYKQLMEIGRAHV